MRDHSPDGRAAKAITTAMLGRRTGNLQVDPSGDGKAWHQDSQRQGRRPDGVGAPAEVAGGQFYFSIWQHQG